MLHEITISAPPDRVFEALTTGDGLSSWWTGDSEAEPEEGSIAVFGFGGRATVFRMRVDELVAGSLVCWACVGDVEEWQGTHLRFELAPTAEGDTRVRFTHGGWQSTDGMFAMCNTTWGALMIRLKEYAEGRSSGPFFTGRAD
jgi:uncharacterized protein YndB with AHSA1/START domain